MCRYSTILPVVIIGVFDAKDGQAQARRFAVLRRLQHVLQRQHRSRFVAQGKRILQEFQDCGFGRQVFRTVADQEIFWELITSQSRPNIA